MDQQQIKSFTERYLQHNKCQIIESSPAYLTSLLSIEVDKDILNRPFYCMYMEKMGLDPEPSQICFVFDNEAERPADLRSEHIFQGSPSFTQLLDSAQKNGKFTRLYEQQLKWEGLSYRSKPYDCYLALNLFISYICDQKKDRLVYLGINLQTGAIIDNFYLKLKEKAWTSALPSLRYIIPGRLPITEAVGELEYYLQEELEKEDDGWATSALARLRMEQQQLAAFYPDTMNDDGFKEKKQKQSELIQQFHPRIEINLVNAGLFYMLKD